MNIEGKQVVVEIKEFGSVEEIEEALDKEISETKSELGEYLSRLDGIRSLAERTKKVRQIVMKLAGKKVDAERLGEISVDNVNVVLDASPLDELTALESVVRSHQERLLKVQKAREGLKPLDELGETEGIRFLIVETDGVPERILLKVC
jgi:vacuolar-type H+-ATPase subunit I/STV1